VLCIDEKKGFWDIVGEGRGAWECDNNGEDEVWLLRDWADDMLEAEVWKAEDVVEDDDVGKAGYGGRRDDLDFDDRFELMISDFDSFVGVEL